MGVPFLREAQEDMLTAAMTVNTAALTDRFIMIP